MLALEGKVALELKNHRRLFQPGDRADARYVINNEPVGGAHILGAQEVDAEHLRARTWRGEWGSDRC